VKQTCLNQTLNKMESGINQRPKYRKSMLIQPVQTEYLSILNTKDWSQRGSVEPGFTHFWTIHLFPLGFWFQNLVPVYLFHFMSRHAIDLKNKFFS